MPLAYRAFLFRNISSTCSALKMKYLRHQLLTRFFSIVFSHARVFTVVWTTVWLALLPLTMVKAQGQRHIFERVSTLELVPDVYSVDTDEHGRIWYSTWGRGVFCYDGYTHKRYMTNSDDTNSILNDRVFDLLVDKHQRVWVSTLGGLSCIDRRTDKVRRFQNILDSVYQFQTAFEDKSGTIWFGAANAFLRLNEAKQDLEIINPDNGIVGKGGRARAFWEDAKGTLWASRTDGLFRFSPDRSTYERVDLIPPNGESVGVIYSMLEGSNGAFLLGTQQGLFYFDQSSRQLIRASLPESMAYRRINAMLEAPKGTFWISLNGQGLLRWDPDKGGFQFFKNNILDPGSLYFNFIHSLTFDRFGNLWIGSSQMVMRIND